MQWYQKQVNKLKTWHMPSLNEYIALIVVVGITVILVIGFGFSVLITTATGHLVDIVKNIGAWV